MTYQELCWRSIQHRLPGCNFYTRNTNEKINGIFNLNQYSGIGLAAGIQHAAAFGHVGHLMSITFFPLKRIFRQFVIMRHNKQQTLQAVGGCHILYRKGGRCTAPQITTIIAFSVNTMKQAGTNQKRHREPQQAPHVVQNVPDLFPDTRHNNQILRTLLRE